MISRRAAAWSADNSPSSKAVSRASSSWRGVWGVSELKETLYEFGDAPNPAPGAGSTADGFAAGRIVRRPGRRPAGNHRPRCRLGRPPRAPPTNDRPGAPNGRTTRLRDNGTTREGDHRTTGRRDYKTATCAAQAERTAPGKAARP